MVVECKWVLTPTLVGKVWRIVRAEHTDRFVAPEQYGFLDKDRKEIHTPKIFHRELLLQSIERSSASPTSSAVRLPWISYY